MPKDNTRTKRIRIRKIIICMLKNSRNFMSGKPGILGADDNYYKGAC